MANGARVGGVVPKRTPEEIQAEADRKALQESIVAPVTESAQKFGAAALDVATLPGRAAFGAVNTVLRLPNALGAGIPYIPESAFGGDSASMTPYYDRLRTPAAAPAAAAPTAPVTPAVVSAGTGVRNYAEESAKWREGAIRRGSTMAPTPPSEPSYPGMSQPEGSTPLQLSTTDAEFNKTGRFGAADMGAINARIRARQAGGVNTAEALSPNMARTIDTQGRTTYTGTGQQASDAEMAARGMVRDQSGNWMPKGGYGAGTQPRTGYFDNPAMNEAAPSDTIAGRLARQGRMQLAKVAQAEAAPAFQQAELDTRRYGADLEAQTRREGYGVQREGQEMTRQAAAGEGALRAAQTAEIAQRTALEKEEMSPTTTAERRAQLRTAKTGKTEKDQRVEAARAIVANPLAMPEDVTAANAYLRSVFETQGAQQVGAANAEAMAWAKANPNDPRSAKILQRLNQG